ncbi:MAG: [FeFe] hydrogenase H-cluster radical SAM maturase HydE [Clostridia bacterium]|nr:[FeFe] hydrogenase H-cluster radical SAM maturase HydE [Clostridia bacterium]
MATLTDRLVKNGDLPDVELLALLSGAEDDALRRGAQEVCALHYGREIYLRGLIEVSSFCKNNCLYCGIRAGNCHAQRYRLSREEILASCEQGYNRGLRTFVLQGGEDAAFTDDVLFNLIVAIKLRHPDCAVTLSLGERSGASYRALKRAGADRYLLRHETADPEHYESLHPSRMSYGNRIRCLQLLKEIGYQVGCGFMVGTPRQTPEMLIKDLRFLKAFQPQMVGIGPFIPHRDTPFAKERPGRLDITLRLLSIIRLMLPKVLLPATTALGTIHPRGRAMGILAGANVIMPNISPREARQKYALYDGKPSSGMETAEGIALIERELEKIGYRVVVSRGDAKI